MSQSLVAVVMGSSSDWETMQHAVEVLDRFEVPHERHIVSAHRTPVWMAEFATAAEGRGVEVIIAGAGGAAHLPGMVAAHTPLPVLGVPGSGQLGRMFTIAARRMGYRVHTFSPEEDTPTGQVADVEVTAEYDDIDALRAFAARVDVVTFEFENVPTEAVEANETVAPGGPSGAALPTGQKRGPEE